MAENPFTKKPDEMKETYMMPKKKKRRMGQGMKAADGAVALAKRQGY
jgi:hypothetical protein